MTGLIDERQERAIRDAVEEAERHSGAELVPVLASASDPYSVADWRGATLGALGAACAAAGWSFASWAPAEWWLVPAAVAAGALLGALVAVAPPARRLLAGAREMEVRVDAAAARSFLVHEVFRTRDRTGILLYVSLFERQVRVLADEGVYAAVERATWEELAREVAAEMKRGAPAEALLSAVRRAGELVERFGPRRRDDDRNELPDAPISA